MSAETLSILTAVVLGFLLGAGVRARGIVEHFGDERLRKLVRLLELLEEPPPQAEETTERRR